MSKGYDWHPVSLRELIKSYMEKHNVKGEYVRHAYDPQRDEIIIITHGYENE